MNTDLVPVFPGTLAGAPALLVNARDLHAFLEVGRDFTNWIKARIEEYEFVDGQGYSPNLANRSDGKPGRRRADYLLSLDMAKELAMVERTDRGRQVRRYFIECEKRLRAVAPEQVEAAQHAAATLTAEQQTAIKELVHSRVEALAQDKRAAAAIKCWSALKAKFGCTYKRIPGAQFTEALSLVARLPLEGELLGREALPPPRLDISFPVSRWLDENPMLARAQIGPRTLTVPLCVLFGMDSRSPTSALLTRLWRDGYDVDACRIELMAMRHHLEVLDEALHSLQRAAAARRAGTFTIRC